jgi:flavin-dependent dehydrogenase
MTEDYDVITIGGGLAGAALAKKLVENGMRVLVLERDAVRCHFRFWHETDLSARPLYVRYWGYFGRHLLALSLTVFAE